MRERKFGHVINISSAGVQTRVPRFGAYIASKTALDTVSDAFQAGNTAGTDALRDLGTVPRVIMQRVVMRCPMWDRFGISHPLEVGAKRLVDALVGGPLESGGFYAGAQQTLTGLLVNQAGIVADFGDDAVQDHAYGAIHAFLRTPSAEEAQP
jgi:hypothetical protein